MKNQISVLGLSLCFSFNTFAWQREVIWPQHQMPHPQAHQVALMTNELSSVKSTEDHKTAYLEWYDAPAKEVDNDGCIILISGGAYNTCCDVDLITQWREKLTKLGFQCVNLVYRTPRPVGLPFYQSAWEDGQRAVRLVRKEARKRGFNPEKIGTISMSAGSHLALLLATSSQTPAYEKVDATDSIPCHINWAIVHAPAYITTDAQEGTPAARQGYGPDVKLVSLLKFDAKTCPMSLHHGGNDPYTPNGSTLVYRKLRQRGIPAELHLYPNIGHAALGFDRAVEFMYQMGYIPQIAAEQPLLDRYSSDTAHTNYFKETIWPAGAIPNRLYYQNEPYLEWYFPKEMKTKAIQIIFSGGNYMNNDPLNFEVAPARRYLNEQGITVVTLKYRTPRPAAETGLAKYITAWQDLQRAIRIVRHHAVAYGLDPNHIGVMGSSAGGHLALLGVTNSLQQSYAPVDELDQLSCSVQWGICIYPAYVLTDGINAYNTTGGNADSAVLSPEFNFDLHTAPTLFVHGDADGWAAMNSVKTWEKMRSMGIQSELHTLAKRPHCFQRAALPHTGSYTYLERVSAFIKHQLTY